MSDFEKVSEMLYEILNMASVIINVDKDNETIHVDIDCFGKFDLKVQNINLYEL